VVLAVESETGTILAGPDIISRGFVYVKESEEIMDQIAQITRMALQKCEEKKKNDWSSKKAFIRDSLRDYLYEKTKRKPMILPIIMEI
jgi:ribonuclease J